MIFRRFTPRLLLGLLLLVAALLLVAGLYFNGRGSDPRNNTAGGWIKQDNAQSASNLDLAMKTIGDLPVSKDPESPARALFYLNQWMGELPEPMEKPVRDPLLSHLPRAYNNSQFLLSLDRRRFERPDHLYLQQNLWFRDIANRVAPRAAPADLQPWLKELEKRIGISDAERVRSAERLFDWTVCNIQLDKLPPPPKAAVAGVGKGDQASLPAPSRGEPGPGYWQLPWQVLLYGHGDAWQRSRVFLLMCRQAGITAHMLGVQDEAGSGAVRPWLCGVLVKEQLYLFDAELGLPLLGPEGSGIATLEQVVADPGLIRSMDIPGESPYRVSDAELQGIQVLIDAEPESLTLRMQMLQSALIGDQRVVLACRPNEEEKELLKCKHVKRASIWRIGLEAVDYQYSLARIRQQNKALQGAYIRETNMFTPPNVLAEARHLQFAGKFHAQADDDKRGAIQVLSQLRISYDTIDTLESSTEARQMLGIRDEMLHKDPNIRAQQIKDIAITARISKNHATYWIGLCHFDEGDYKDATEWFRDRTMNESQNSPWLPGARYNLARCYEAQGKWDMAREIYLNDESPQRMGNLLRAQRIAGKKK